MKGQSSMIAIAVAIVMLIFIMLFMITTTVTNPPGQVIRSEFRNLYAHNLLLSLLRTDTSCGTFSEVLKGAYFGGGKCDSMPFLDEKIPGYIKTVLNATGNTDYGWYIQATPKKFVGSELGFGNPAVKDSLDRWDARTMITWEGYQLEVKLYITLK